MDEEVRLVNDIFVSQKQLTHRSYYGSKGCVPACIEMVLKYHKYTKLSYHTEDYWDLKLGIYTTLQFDKDGVNLEDVSKWFKEINIEARCTKNQVLDSKLITSIVDSIKKNNPVILCLSLNTPQKNICHAVLLTKITYCINCTGVKSIHKIYVFDPEENESVNQRFSSMGVHDDRRYNKVIEQTEINNRFESLIFIDVN